MGAPRPKEPVKDEVTYFFLVKNTEKGAELSPAQRQQEINEVTGLVIQEGGQCHLYSTRGSPFDFVSVITGITTTTAAVRIAEEIEKRGTVKATLISGVEIFYTP
jgi:uncharacterized protein with GYD domain